MLKKSFFARDAEIVARELLGKILRVKYRHHWLAAQIIETEAYYMREKGSHSSLGRTPSREAMFMPAGTIYMYYSRGKDSLNVSIEGEGNAVLIKSAVPYEDKHTDKNMITIMQQLNPFPDGRKRIPRQLCAGQTLLCSSLHLKVTRWNKQSFDREHFYIDDVNHTPKTIFTSTRKGIATHRDAHLPLRFFMKE